VNAVREDLRRFDDVSLSHLADHGRPCCSSTRRIVLGQLLQHIDLASQLATVPEVVPWGGFEWPGYWCGLMDGETIRGDCGVHALLVSTLLTRRGIPHVRGWSAIQATELARDAWRSFWRRTCPDASTTWIGTHLIRHEVVKVGTRWWDPTEATWFSGCGARLLAGRVIAVRELGGNWQVADDGT
jgi:hypothetical protein